MHLPPQSTLTDAKYQAILQRLKALGINLSDIEEHFVRGSSKGGQKINKTASAVQLRHLPTGTVVKYQKHRERPMNRILALRELLERLDPDQKSTRTAAIRKQKARRHRRSQSEKIV